MWSAGNDISDNKFNAFSIDNVIFTQGDKEISFNNFSISAEEKENNSKVLNIYSDYVNGYVKGIYTFSDIVKKHKTENTKIGIDVSHWQGNIDFQKVKDAGLEGRISFAKEDCTALSFPDKRFDAITVAFGVRNFEDLDKGLQEMHRVLDNGGKLVILELSEPEWFPMKQLYALYSKVVIPTLGKLLSKDRSAYTYLPQSIKAFPQGEIMKDIILKAGFKEAGFKRLTLGICTLYTATK